MGGSVSDSSKIFSKPLLSISDFDGGCAGRTLCGIVSGPSGLIGSAGGVVILGMTGGEVLCMSGGGVIGGVIGATGGVKFGGVICGTVSGC